MTLVTGDIDASSGMTKAIFEELDNYLMTSEEKNKLKTEDLENIRNGWRKLSFGIAKGIISYLENNLEIIDIKTIGNINAAINGDTDQGGTDNHTHHISLSCLQNNVEFLQSDDGIGHVKKNE